MKPSHEALPQLRQIIERHFPKAKAQDISNWADNILSAGQAARSLQWLERSNTRPSEDIERLKKLGAKLRLASEEARQLGWHGAKAVTELSAQIHKMNNDLPVAPVLGAEGAVEVLSDFLRGLGDTIYKRAQKIDRNAPGVMTAFSDGMPAGRPRNAPTKTQAYFIAAEAKSAFHELSGTPPTRAVDRKSSKPVGQFHDFVTAIFVVLDVKASADSTIRKVLDNKS